MNLVTESCRFALLKNPFRPGSPCPMPIYEVTDAAFRPLAPTRFETEGLYERRDLQRLLRDQIGVLDDSLMVVAEEFGDWQDSTRRIDLLCLDRDARLVVVELKRGEDGGHMELQALRYAAMVSGMTFEQLVETHRRYRLQRGLPAELAQASILEFLGWSDVQEDQFAQETRLLLASADFSRELTTCVMWLNERGLDIRCIRLKPYRMDGGPLLIDVQQLIPLPEASDFQTQIGAKRQAERQERSERHEVRYRFWEGLLPLARARSEVHANRSPTTDYWLAGSAGRAGFQFTYVIREQDSQVELWIGQGAGQRERNKAAYMALRGQHEAIEREFGAELDWQELPDKEGCRIRALLPGGYRAPIEHWPEIQAGMVDAMVRLDHALRQRIASLRH